MAIAAPFLIVAMVIGLLVSLFQAVTTIHEQTLTFVPKAAAVVGALVLLMPWLIRTLVEFTTSIIEKIPQMVQ
jgi:flagellar biosynthetic protein FliQ